MEFQFSGELFTWRGPSPFHFVTVPAEVCLAIRAMAAMVSYGWGVIPVTVRIGATEWTTSLFPKDGRYLVPVKDVIRKAERIADGDTIDVQLMIHAA